jgi:GATA-binding protein, other eukaryote
MVPDSPLPWTSFSISAATVNLICIRRLIIYPFPNQSIFFAYIYLPPSCLHPPKCPHNTNSHHTMATTQHHTMATAHHPQPASTQPEHSRKHLESAAVLRLLNAAHDSSSPVKPVDHTSTSALTSVENNTAPASDQEQHPSSQYPPIDPAIPTYQNSPSPSATSPSIAPQSPASGQTCSNCGTTRTPLWRRSPSGEIICNACGLYLKARNQQRPTNLKRGPNPLGGRPELTDISNQTIQPATSAPNGNGVATTTTVVPVENTSSGTCPGDGRCNGTGGHAGCSGCPAFNNRISKAQHIATQAQDSSNISPQSPTAQNGLMPACQNCGTTVTPLWRRDDNGHTICNACGKFLEL